jgi:hypothetical protein
MTTGPLRGLRRQLTPETLPLGERHLRQSVSTVYHWITSFPGVLTIGDPQVARFRSAAQALRNRRGGVNSAAESRLIA